MSFLGIHLFPTIMVYLGCLPLYGMTRAGAAGFGWPDGIGAVVMLGAIVLAFVADEQMRAFRRSPANQGLVMRNGLWSRSRHPNYLGEVATWWGLWLFAMGAGGRWWWTVAGAIAITVPVRLRERSHDGAASCWPRAVTTGSTASGRLCWCRGLRTAER